ncbi:hypothetical protein ACF0H5_002283 [Mactra antiquata]
MEFLYFWSVITIVNAKFYNPFADEDLFSINWAGSIDIDALKKEKGDLEIVPIQTNDNEHYFCVIPESRSSIDSATKHTYNGPTPEELMDGLFTQSACSYRIESYWTYELCHGKHLRQYHEDKELGLKKPELKEYYLGKMPLQSSITKAAKTEETEDDDKVGPTTVKETHPSQEILSIKLDGIDLPYFSVNFTHGSVCDVTGKPRISNIMYVCQLTGRGEIYQLKETSSCEYSVIVLTSALCQHPAFKPKDPPVSKINCHPSGNSPIYPQSFKQLQIDQGIFLNPESNSEDEEEPDTPKPQSQPKPTPPPPQRAHVDTTIGKQADDELIRDFLNGDYCIHGGGGWWKHEYCHNRHAKQYHEEPSSITQIYLGYWDKQKHLDWLAKNPSKKPKPVGSRKHVSLYYAGGDICDVTGKPRFVEVKLKCLNKPGQPHAVSIYLVEPTPCEYVLGVESPLLCDILDQADENGFMDHIKV